MKKVQDVCAFIFITCVAILAVVSILGVWNILGEDVITKSMQTIGLLAGVAAIVIIAGRFVHSGDVAVEAIPVPVNPAFTGIRKSTVALLITSISLLALLGVLAIWDVLEGEVLEKSLASISVVAFAAFVIVVTCLQREQHKLLNIKMSGWVVFLVILLGWWFLRALFWF